MNAPKLIPYGPHGFLIQFEQEISLSLSRSIQQLRQELESQKLKGVIALIPAYNSLTVFVDEAIFQRKELTAFLADWKNLENTDKQPPRKLNIPVCYGGDDGPDLKWLAEYHHLSEEELIKLHCNIFYQLYIFGFLPGFAYLGDVPTDKQSPRLSSPRTRVTAGSIAISGKQTAIYPSDSSGGWQIIGKTPIAVVNPDLSHPFLFRLGDEIQFFPIEEEAFRALSKHPFDWEQLYV